MAKKYYYIFQIYEDIIGGNYTKLTSVEVVAENYDEAIKQVPGVLKKGDDRKVWNSSIVEKPEKEEKHG